MGPDSRSQFQQARSFHFTDDHPVLMALIWHYLDRLVPGPLGMLVFTNALVWAGLSALFWVLPGPLGWRALGFVLVGFWPPGFSALPIVYKDALMHGAMLVAIAAAIPDTRRALAARLALGVVCAFSWRSASGTTVRPLPGLSWRCPSCVCRWWHGYALGSGCASDLVGASSTTYRYCVWTMMCTLLAVFALARPKPGARRLDGFRADRDAPVVPGAHGSRWLSWR
jgi:hypothetical protein